MCHSLSAIFFVSSVLIVLEKEKASWSFVRGADGGIAPLNKSTWVKPKGGGGLFCLVEARVCVVSVSWGRDPGLAVA